MLVVKIARPHGTMQRKCRHGDFKVLRVTQAMNGSQSGLQNHLKVLENKHKTGGCPALGELMVAQGELPLDCLGYNPENLPQHSLVSSETVDKPEPFDHTKYEQYLTEWVAACDQPFNAVEAPKFIRLLQYISQLGKEFKLMEMGDDIVSDIKTMLAIVGH
ncbi:hypothetical protein WOLCODRAFT_18293 [Wolfiporia cocos MD-104 SS10]|uniref:Uncharacterized protein n=1 Tax=Wolfiporia cocos (strain MD-104) TaxID=742152 RepID=A0A2H3JM96_WOLCO|nr:hypothetical protein WOLCODRAFT_18293 [Wolfiporia cocos MD-104 SS10]